MESIELFGWSSVKAVLRLRRVLRGSVPRPAVAALFYFHVGNVT